MSEIRKMKMVGGFSRMMRPSLKANVPSTGMMILSFGSGFHSGFPIERGIVIPGLILRFLRVFCPCFVTGVQTHLARF